MKTLERSGRGHEANPAIGICCDFPYGETVIVATLLVTLPIVAVTVTVPPVAKPDMMVTFPADTVARSVLLEVHVATLVTSSDPLHVAAVAVIEIDGSLVVIVPLVGLKVID
jgi:hypothetical protein